MEVERIRVMEHLAVECPFPLDDFCRRMQERFGLPGLRCDCENETEWCAVEHEGIEYNVSRPYAPGTLQTWDDTVPPGCHFGVTLIVSRDCLPEQDTGWSTSVLVPRVGQALADLFGRPVYHHRTWIGVGRNVPRSGVFHPRSGPGCPDHRR